MTRKFFALILTLAPLSASAIDWPWQDASPKPPSEYCRGFVAGGLASKLVSGTSRTDLWLAWSYIIGTDGERRDTASSAYQEGLALFHNAQDTAAVASILQQADGECGLGRSGFQITGW